MDSRAPGWTVGRAAALFGGLLVLEALSAAAWVRLPVPQGLSAFARACPGLVAWMVGPLEPRGGVALQEIAVLAWTGLMRGLDLLIVWMACRAWRNPWPALSSPGRRLSSGALACMTAFGFGAAVFLCQILSLWRGVDFLRLLAGPADPAYAIAGAVVAVVLVQVVFAPFVEEVLFRGVLLESLAGAMRPAAAVVLSAAVFALFHVPFVGFPIFQFLGGLAFGWLTRRTGGILAAWILHAAANAFVLALQVHCQGA